MIAEAVAVAMPIPRACGDEPPRWMRLADETTIPRACGDEPLTGQAAMLEAVYSPRLRG